MSINNMATNDHGKELISWEFPEFRQHERSRGWYIVAIVIGALLLLYSVFTMNFLFALVIIITAMIFFLRMSAEVQDIKFAIYEDGIQVGEKFHEFKAFSDFYVIYEPPEIKTLYLNFDSLLNPRLSIPLGDINPIKVREILLDYLEEDLEQEEEAFSDFVERLFKL